MIQRILQWILNFFGTIYVLIEQFVEYPDDSNILGMPIDDDLQNMSRQKLCRYMDAVLPKKGFFDIQSTSKIRLGCQLLREYKVMKKELGYPNKMYPGKSKYYYNRMEENNGN